LDVISKTTIKVYFFLDVDQKRKILSAQEKR